MYNKLLLCQININSLPLLTKNCFQTLPTHYLWHTSMKNMNRNTKNVITYVVNSVAIIFHFLGVVTCQTKTAKERTSSCQVGVSLYPCLHPRVHCSLVQPPEPPGNAQDPAACGLCTFSQGLSRTSYLECINNVPGIFQYLFHLLHCLREWKFSVGKADFL